MKKNCPLKLTLNHEGKMEGMQSLNTSTKTNPLCIKNREIKGSICQKCYAFKNLSYRKNVSEAYEKNEAILTKRLLTNEEIPLLNTRYFRFEAFGDLHNEIQLQNYINICKKNKHVDFALWTKNYKLILEYFKSHKKPSNLRLLISSLMINQPINKKPFEAINLQVSIFTVYSKDYVKENDIKINCGGKKCIECLRCYKRGLKNQVINELVK